MGWKFVNCRGRGEEVPGPSKIMASTIHEDQKTTETSALRGAEGRQDPEVTLFENFVSQEEAPIVHPRRFGRRWSISSRSARAVGSGRRSRRATWVAEVEVLSGPEASDLHGLNTGSAEHPLGAGPSIERRRAFFVAEEEGYGDTRTSSSVHLQWDETIVTVGSLGSTFAHAECRSVLPPEWLR